MTFLIVLCGSAGEAVVTRARLPLGWERILSIGVLGLYLSVDAADEQLPQLLRPGQFPPALDGLLLTIKYARSALGSSLLNLPRAVGAMGNVVLRSTCHIVGPFPLRNSKHVSKTAEIHREPARFEFGLVGVCFLDGQQTRSDCQDIDPRSG